MTERISRNEYLANRMRMWAAIVLVICVLGGFFFPNTALIFAPNIQEAWQVLRPIGWALTQFGLPFSAALFVGAIIVRRLPEGPLKN